MKIYLVIKQGDCEIDPIDEVPVYESSTIIKAFYNKEKAKELLNKLNDNSTSHYEDGSPSDYYLEETELI